MIEYLHRVQQIIGSNPLSSFEFQPVLYGLYNKGCGVHGCRNWGRWGGGGGGGEVGWWVGTVSFLQYFFKIS